MSRPSGSGPLLRGAAGVRRNPMGRPLETKRNSIWDTFTIALSCIVAQNYLPVSYTHLRAHETEADL
eukprot:5862147-Amphidinium_carterae.1